MFRPEDPFAPRGPAFDEPWQAQVLALAEGLVRAGHFTAVQWAESLGGALREADEGEEPDTNATYYLAAVTALERLTEALAGITAGERLIRKHAWEQAYLHTPHGQSVRLSAAEGHDDHDHD